MTTTRQYKEGFGIFAKWVDNDINDWDGDHQSLVHTYTIMQSGGAVKRTISQQDYRCVHIAEYECIADREIVAYGIRPNGQIVGVTNEVGNLIGTRIRFVVESSALQTDVTKDGESRTIHHTQIGVLKLMNGHLEPCLFRILCGDERESGQVRGFTIDHIVPARTPLEIFRITTKLAEDGGGKPIRGKLIYQGLTWETLLYESK